MEKEKERLNKLLEKARAVGLSDYERDELHDLELQIRNFELENN